MTHNFPAAFVSGQRSRAVASASESVLLVVRKQLQDDRGIAVGRRLPDLDVPIRPR